MPYRPRDVCSAAFYNDVARLRLLAHQDAPGGTGYRFRLERFTTPGADGNHRGGSNEHTAMYGEEEDEATLFDESLEAVLEADPEMQRVRQQYTLDEEEEAEAAEDEDLAGNASVSDAAVGADGDGNGFDGEAIAADLAAQEADFERFKALLRHAMREKHVVALLQKQGLLRSGSSAADVTDYGVLFTAQEEPFSASHAADAADQSGRVKCTETRAPGTGLAVRWLPVMGSPYTAAPLHWAVLGRAHDAVCFLIESGVDPTQAITYDPKSDRNSNGSSATAGAFTFPPFLTAAQLAEANASGQTQRRLAAAIAARHAVRTALESAKQHIEGALEQRKARQEKRRLGRDQRRAAHEERKAAREVEEVGEEEEEEEYDAETGGRLTGSDRGDVTDNEGDY